MGRRGNAQRLIHHQRQRDAPPVGGAIQQVFDDRGTRIGIDLDVHDEAPQQIAREWDRTPGLHAGCADGGRCHAGMFRGVSLWYRLGLGLIRTGMSVTAGRPREWLPA